MIKNKIEILSHLLFWIFLFFTININWSANWFDPTIRPNTPAPLSLLFFAFFFYINAFFLIPKYFNKESYKKYIVYAFVLFIIPELIRVSIFKLTFLVDTSFENALFSRDSFLFGTPSPFFFALNLSFIYALTKGWFKKKSKKNVSYEHVSLISDDEASKLEHTLLHQLEKEEVYLNPDLTLRDLAKTIGSTEKKVSYLINKNLETNYYELINKYRVEKFKTEVIKSENKDLSMVGIALNCGFKSKSSFYRAFKLQVSVSPSVYTKNLLKTQ